MKVAVAVLLVVILAVVLVVILAGNGSPESGPERPEDGAPTGSSDPVPPIQPAEPPPPKAPDTAERIRVVTNVAGATVGLSVLLVGGLPDPEIVTQVAGEDGVAEFAAPPAELPVNGITASAKAPGYRPASARVREGEAILTLEPGFALSGRVEDRAGNPLQDATLRGPEAAYVYTDADGRFEVFVPEAVEVELAVAHYAHKNTTLTATAPADDLLVVLERGLEISGRVSFPDGKPVPGAGLQTSGVWALATADEDGRYVLAGFEPGDVELRCNTSDEKRTVPAGSSNVDFVLSRHLVNIRFTDTEGRPFRRASVWIRGVRDEDEIFTSVGGSGEDGVFVTRVPTGTELQISPAAPGHEEKVTKVTIDGEPRLHEVVVVIAPEGPRGTLDLRILDDAGEPRVNAVISLANESGSLVASFHGREVSLDEEGRCRVDAPPGRFTLTIADSTRFVSLTGYALEAEREIVVEPGEQTSLEVALQTGGRVRVTVQNADGDLVAAGRADLIDESGDRVPLAFIREFDGGWTTALDEPGAALLGKPVPPGRYRIRVTTEDGQKAEREIAIAPDKTEEIEIRLPRK